MCFLAGEREEKELEARPMMSETRLAPHTSWADGRQRAKMTLWKLVFQPLSRLGR
jgi:hypothetical protein